MANEYVEKQIKRVIEENKDSIYPLKMQILGDEGRTYWMNISPEQAKKIAEIFAEKKDEG